MGFLRLDALGLQLQPLDLRAYLVEVETSSYLPTETKNSKLWNYYLARSRDMTPNRCLGEIRVI